MAEEQQGAMDVQEAAEAAPAEAAAPIIATPDAVKAAERAALNVHKKVNLQSATLRQYLEATVVPVLMQGMQAVVKERPENPVEFLAYYLLSHNPQKPAAAGAATAPATGAAPTPAAQ